MAGWLLLAGSLEIARACQPCAEMAGFEYTAASADLVIVGNAAPGTESGGVPESIVLEVKQVLKGEEKRERIEVNSWDGMCPYGIQVGEAPHVIFLMRREGIPPSDPVEFDSVSSGCALKMLPLEGDKVTVDGEALTLEELRARIAAAKTGR